MDLDAIRQRADNATPGPWVVAPWHDVLVIDKPWADYNEGGPKPDHELPCTYAASPDDAEFIAHAREDVPWLLAELVRVQAENTQLREENEKLKEHR